MLAQLYWLHPDGRTELRDERNLGMEYERNSIHPVLGFVLAASKSSPIPEGAKWMLVRGTDRQIIEVA